MANGIRTGDPRGFNKGRSSKFCVDYRVRQTPKEGRRTYRQKRYGNNNNSKDEDDSPKTLNGKNHQASSQKFGQLLILPLSHVSKLFFFLVLWRDRSICESVRFLLSSLTGLLKWQNLLDDEGFFWGGGAMVYCFFFFFFLVNIRSARPVCSAGIEWSVLSQLSFLFEFFTPTFAVVFSLKFEWQQISWGLRDSSQYSGRS